MIVGYTGRVGQGKTMLAVQEVIRTARIRNAMIASNIRIEWEGEYRRLEVAENGLAEVAPILTEARERGVGVVVFVDEIGIVLPARFWATNTAIDLMWACSQSRKLGADLFFTCQHISQLDAFLRRIADHVWSVWAFPAPTLIRREKGKRPWFFRLTKWDVFDMDSMKPEKRLDAEWKRYRREWEAAYDTDELVRPPTSLQGKGVKSRAKAPEVSASPAGFSPLESAQRADRPPLVGGAAPSRGESGEVLAAPWVASGDGVGEPHPSWIGPAPSSLDQRT